MWSAEQRAGVLADLPLMPRDDDGPVFAESWQAQVFAVAVELIESEKISGEDWADRLGVVFKAAEERGEYDTGARYYDHWLTALEKLVVEKDLAGWDDLTSEKELIRENDHHRREHQIEEGK